MVICYYQREFGRIYPGYEGKYQVSNTGQVRALNYRGNTGKTKILKPSIGAHGYKRINLYKDGKRKTYLVHRLVAQAFIPNPNDYPVVNHKDENKTNNVVWNLEFCTREYNNNYGTRNERISEAHTGKPLTEEHKKRMSENHADFKGKNHPNYGKGKPILMYTLDGQFIKRFDCVPDANEFLGKPRRNDNIGMCARGISETAYGYKWEYEE